MKAVRSGPGLNGTKHAQLLAQSERRQLIGAWHASCSCCMGRPEDPMSVVESTGRMKGIEGRKWSLRSTQKRSCIVPAIETYSE